MNKTKAWLIAQAFKFAIIKHKENMMGNNQKGLSTVQAVVLVILVAIIGIAGWLIYDKNNSDSGDEKAGTVIRSNVISNDAQPISPNHVDITEWGARLSFADADKVTYQISTNSAGQQVAELYFKDTFTSVNTCRDLGVGFVNGRKVIDAGDNITAPIYQLTGNAKSCSADASIDQEVNKIVKDQLAAGKYTITKIQ